MRALRLILRREFLAYFRTPIGVVIAACVLLADGLFFNAYALGRGSKLSSEVLADFFYFSSGFVMIASVLLSMRLLAEERQNASYPVLYAAPVRDWQIVLGKYLSAYGFLVLLVMATLYMPAMIFVNGRVSLGHIAGGYLGLLLLGAASLAIGVFGSALARSQILAAITSALILVTFLLFWLLSRVTDPPLAQLLAYLALWDKHFRPFLDGVVSTGDAVYYLSLATFFLLASTRVVEARRWR